MQRLALLFAVLALIAGCKKADDGGLIARGDTGVKPATIACALDGSDTFVADCSVERFAGKDGTLLVLGRGDSGFRRFRLTDDGRGLAAADGAEAARVTIAGSGEVEVQVGSDRYRLPATIKGEAPVGEAGAPPAP